MVQWEMRKNCCLWRALTTEHTDFFTIKGAGRGDHATIAYMADLRSRATDAFGTDFAEQKICGPNSLCVDFYFPSGSTVVDVALGLRNPNTEFEKDVLKAVMAQEAGHSVKRLFFITKPGGKRKCEQPGRRAFIEWAHRKHGIRIEVHELELHT